MEITCNPQRWTAIDKNYLKSIELTCNQDHGISPNGPASMDMFSILLHILNDIHLILVNADIKLLKISLNMSAAHADDKPTWWKWSWPSTGAQCVWCLLYTYSLPPVNLQYRDKISKHAHSVESQHTLQCYYLLLLSAGRSDRQQPGRQPAAEEGQTCAQRQQDSWPRYRESSRDWTSDEIFQSLWWDFSLCNIIADRVGR